MNIVFQYLRKASAFLLLLLLLYLLVAFIGSLISVNKNLETNTFEFEVFLISNGVHTDIAVPLKTEIFNWTEIVKPEYTLSQLPGNYLSFGWGDLEFYKSTPEWKDLSLYTAATAIFLKSQSALHITFKENIQENKNSVLLKMNKVQYQKLVTYIIESFETDAFGKPQPIPNLHYNERDVFFEAKGSLNLFKTCNTWTNSALKHAGVKACLWTPFADGVMHPYR